MKVSVDLSASRGVIASTCGIETTTIIGAQALNSMGRELALISVGRG
jgi:lactate dehydrogenase-like 2-hydroxyacid dehydrogenase